MMSREPKTKSREKKSKRFRFGDVSPSDATVRELTWFFNEAESAMEEPSNYCRLVAGGTASTADEEVARIEALHAAGKINAWLAAVHTTEALLLAGLFTERAWPRRVERALGVLAGAVEASPVVRAEHLRAVATVRTSAKTVTARLVEVIAHVGPASVVAWKRDAERACAIAIRAYERARGTGPCAAPDDGAVP
jgi:hypothetical protein